jgi:dephospho-CoA kinase
MTAGMQRIGLTGGIGSGKSTVLQMLAELGAATVDADAVSRSVTAPGGAAMAALRERFGPDYMAADGSLDRARMREHAFADPKVRADLEAIIHPRVGAAIREQEQQALAQGRPCLVYDIPLLVESAHWRHTLDRVVVIDCSPETQVTRVMARSALPEAQVRAILAAQASRAQRLAAADVVICNEGLTLAALKLEVRAAAMSFGL